jgi:hypothetical protein
MPENPRRDLCITSKTLTQIDPGEKTERRTWFLAETVQG